MFIFFFSRGLRCDLATLPEIHVPNNTIIIYFGRSAQPLQRKPAFNRITIDMTFLSEPVFGLRYNEEKKKRIKDAENVCRLKIVSCLCVMYYIY